MTAFARSAFPVVAGLFVACGVLQVFLAGIGVFDVRAGFEDHRFWGYTFGWLTIVMLVLALAGRLGRTLVGLSVLLIVQFALQSVLVLFRGDFPAIAALHPVNGFAILAVGVVATRRSWASRRLPGPTPDGAQPNDAVAEAG